MSGEDRFLQELRKVTDQAKADLDKFLAFIKSQKLDAKEKQALRIQFYQALIDLDLDDETTKEAAAKFEKLMELP